MRAWFSAASTPVTLVASNDAPRDGSPAQQAPGVDGFRWLSAEYMRDEALEAGFEDAATEEFRYHRPVSGERVRAIVTCKLGR